MTRLDSVDAGELREWLDHVEQKESTEWIMMAIAHAGGVDIDDLANWYDRSPNEIRDWFNELETSNTVIAMAEKEGVDFEDLAEQYGLSPRTVREWFARMETEPIEEAARLINRYGEQQTSPVFRHQESRVEYLDYQAIEDREWSIEDDDLFEKASVENLDPEEYGRILVEPDETILEAAENRGFEWPYACRGGACANCAVLVKEGDVAMPGNNVLSDEQINTLNARLTCVGKPVTDEIKLVKNVQHLDEFDDLRLPYPLAETA